MSSRIAALLGGAAAAVAAGIVVYKWTKRYDAVVFDCDGVLWQGDTVIRGAPEAIAKLEKAGKKVFYVTNAGTKTREAYMPKFHKLGFKSATIDQLTTSASACADYLRREQCFKGSKVYVLGEPSVGEELEKAGVQCLGMAADGYNNPKARSIQPVEMSQLEPDPEVTAVVVAFDSQLNYYKLAMAALYVQRGARFVATNADRQYPCNSRKLPANGTLVGSVAMTCEKPPDVVCGKPNPVVMEGLLQDHQLDPRKVLMVGDRLDTDIEFGINAGVDTMLVLSGCTDREAALLAGPHQCPTWVAQDISVFS